MVSFNILSYNSWDAKIVGFDVTNLRWHPLKFCSSWVFFVVLDGFALQAYYLFVSDSKTCYFNLLKNFILMNYWLVLIMINVDELHGTINIACYKLLNLCNQNIQLGQYYMLDMSNNMLQ